MLRIIPSASAKGAKHYYSTADYYSEGQELVGRWGGKGARLLGLSGTVEQQAWDALCDNRDPRDPSRPLTLRQKANRRVGYDFNFHAPKSLSLLHGLTGDDRLLAAFRASVDETMRDMEAAVQARVRVNGSNENRTTGNLVYGEFIHTTARPVDGLPDPHLHAHCFVFNATFDPHEGRWKAAEIGSIKRDAPYFEAVFHARLARRMEELGLTVERTRTGWELAGLSKPVLNRFARRTALIEAEAKAKGITDPHEKDGLGAKTRERKQKQLSIEELRGEWRSWLEKEESGTLDGLQRRIGSAPLPEDPTAARHGVDLATEHWFERQSVVPERKVLRDALRRSVGKASLASVQREFDARSFINATREGQKVITTREVLAEERAVIDWARQGRGTRRPLGGAHALDHRFTDARLNAGQRRAVLHVLSSPDRVILVRGAAGVGKTTMLKEAVSRIEANGRKVFAFAPSADASRGTLRVEGFPDADTVSRLLVDERLQEQVHGQVLLIDEAGLLGTRAMRQLFDVAQRTDARVILVGDKRQHSSVERGSALRLLETEAGLIPAELKQIQRQAGQYRQAVEALSEGRVEDAFTQLHDMGWIREVEDGERYQRMAQDYLAKTQTSDTALVVSPTHREGDKITAQIRSALKASGRLGSKERVFNVLENANLTQAERSDPLSYTPDHDVLVFHQNARGFRRGQRVTVGSPECPSVPLDQAARFQVFHPETLPLAVGDIVRITRNGTAANGTTRLNNGSLYRVRGFSPQGDILTGTDAVIPKDYGHLSYGYTVTSFAAQGKSVHHVLIGQSSESFPASSQQQAYVSISRGKRSATLYTDDAKALLQAVKHSDEKLTATELVQGQRQRVRAAALHHGRAEHDRAMTAASMHRHQREREAIGYER